MTISENAEAGPSKPRESTTAAPNSDVPSTPKAATTTKHVKRRSWFGLGSPVIPTTPSTKQDKEKNIDPRGSTEEVELDDVGNTGDHSQSQPTGKVKQKGEKADEELLTIDGDIEQTVKKKKRRSKPANNKSKSKNEDDFEDLRMSDLGDKIKSSSHKHTQTTNGSDETIFAAGDVTPLPPFTPRSFSRTASDRDPFTPTPPSLQQDALDITPRSSTFSAQAIAPRSSSLISDLTRPINTLPPFQTEKSLPPIWHDRPLPPLPPSPPDGHSPPSIPREIVVTPSSPNQSTRPATPTQASQTGRRSRSKGASSGEASQTRAQSSTRQQTIGLGLPSNLLPASHIDEPPPVPSKTSPRQQSVSSPLPSRSTSPIPKIAFVEPDEPPPERDRDRGRQPEESRKLIKRTRSLSIFGKSPPALQSAIVNGNSLPPQRDLSPAAETSTAAASKSQGVLEWLGVRKTIKRRHSEAKLKEQSNQQDLDNQHTPKSPSIEQNIITDGDKGKSRESLTESETVHGHTTQTPRRPNSRTASATSASTVAVAAHGTPGKLASLFSRRASTKTTEAEDEVELPPPLPAPIPIVTRTDRRDIITTASSLSYFTLPSVDPKSPFVPQSGPWVDSPTETTGGGGEQEVLFNPEEGANWGPGIRPWMDSTEVRSSRSSISSPLSSLPEQTVTPDPPSLCAPTSAREGRVRSWSDAPLPQSLTIHGHSSHPHLAPQTPTSPGLHALSRSLQPSPQTFTRPSLGGRSNSGNSAIIGRMKSVFSKSTGRSRSNSLLRQTSSSDIDEFGGLQGSQRMLPSTSTSSVASSTMGRQLSPSDLPVGNLLNLNESPRASFERSPQTSLAPSISSNASGSTRQSVGFDISHETTNKTTTVARKNRARASTVSNLGPTSYHYTPPSPNIFPAAATPPRRRPGTIHRLSTGLFGSGPSSPKISGTLFPLPPRSSGSISSSTTAGGQPWDEQSTGTGLLSPGTSPRPSTGSVPPLTSAAIKQISTREGDESPKEWLEKIVSNVGRHDIAAVLASSGDEFCTEALQLYMGTFDFAHNPLDVALRRLLMHMSLPKETQQIDRVIEAFAVRYEQCEPGLFGTKDNTYVVAFSMMMLHTDAFNKHNKNKMTKPDYVRNTRLDGVSPLVLETFFDNITFTPFVFIEDDMDLRRSSGYETSSTSVFGPSTPTFSGVGVGLPNGPPPPPKSSKIDVYHMIVRGLLGSLRVDVEHQIPAENPYLTLGTRPFLDYDGLHRAFTDAHGLLIPAPQRRVPGKLTTSRRSPARAGTGVGEGEMVLRVTKVGLLSRKDDGGESRKSSRKWKSWSVILTGSQLLFFKDPIWALTLLEQASSHSQSTNGKKGQQLLLPRMTVFKPDEVFPVKDCVAIFDRTFNAYPNTFRFVMSNGQQYLMQAPDEYEMNEWITLINYAAAFKSAGIKMRGSSMRKDQAALAGAAAAASHKRQLQGGDSQTSLGTSRKAKAFGQPISRDEPVDTDGDEEVTAQVSMQDGLDSEATTTKLGQVDVDDANQVVQQGEQLEEVFGAVKAELAAGRGGASIAVVGTNGLGQESGTTSQELQRERKAHSRTTSRVELVQNQAATLQERKTLLDNSIRTSLTLARNLAILTAFQKSTREKISSAIPSLAQKIRLERIQTSKIEFWLNVLTYEKGFEEREFARVRHLALQAANSSLRKGLGDTVKDINDNDNDDQQVPVPMLSLPGSESDVEAEEGEGEGRNHIGTSPGADPGELPISFSRRTSDDLPPSTRTPRTSSKQITRNSNQFKSRSERPSELLLGPVIRDDSPLQSQELRLGEGEEDNNIERIGNEGTAKDNSGHSTPMMLFHMENPLDVENENGNHSSHPDNGKTKTKNEKDKKEEKANEVEIAEEWHSTRAARRVSLVSAGGDQREDWDRLRSKE